MASEGTYVKDGLVVDAVAAATVASGEVLRLSDGRASVRTGLNEAASGDTIGQQVEGVFDFDSASATTFSLGDPVFWDYSANAAVAADDALDGANDFYLGVAVKAKTSGQLKVRVALNVDIPFRPQVYEFDCETGVDAAAHTLIPAVMNKRGLLITGVYGIVTERFGGGTEDQGIITVSDSASTQICTLTASDAGADVLNDVIVGASNAPVFGASTGTLISVVPAGRSVTAAVTQATSGTSVAGKMRVYIFAVPLV